MSMTNAEWKTSVAEFIEKDDRRKEKRNIRDRLAREFIRDFPFLKEDPSIEIDTSLIPDGTTEAAIRGIARFYFRRRSDLLERRVEKAIQETNS